MSFTLKSPKKIIILLSLVLAFFMSTQSLGTASANSDIKELTTSDEFKEKQEVVQKSLVFKDGVYQIDEAIANGKLTDDEIEQVNLFL